jgi:hypothetical protein
MSEVHFITTSAFTLHSTQTTHYLQRKMSNEICDAWNSSETVKLKQQYHNIHSQVHGHGHLE